MVMPEILELHNGIDFGIFDIGQAVKIMVQYNKSVSNCVITNTLLYCRKFFFGVVLGFWVLGLLFCIQPPELSYNF